MFNWMLKEDWRGWDCGGYTTALAEPVDVRGDCVDWTILQEKRERLPRIATISTKKETLRSCARLCLEKKDIAAWSKRR